MIHIVFNEADIKVLQEAIALDETLQGEIIHINDDYAVGPLTNIYVGEGIENRKRWWHEVLIGGDYEGSIESVAVNDYKTIAKLVGTLRRDEAEIIWIWAAQNKHDVCGYYWLLHYMKEFQNRVFILYLNNLPFINEKGNIFYPECLHEIPAKEFLKAKKLAREITPSEFEVDPDEWTKISEESKGIRLLEGGKKLIQYDYDYFDAELKKYVTGEWQKGSKIISNFLNKAKNTTSYAYLFWRLRTLATKQVFETQGGVKNMKDLEFKIE